MQCSVHVVVKAVAYSHLPVETWSLSLLLSAPPAKGRGYTTQPLFCSAICLPCWALSDHCPWGSGIVDDGKSYRKKGGLRVFGCLSGRPCGQWTASEGSGFTPISTVAPRLPRQASTNFAVVCLCVLAALIAQALALGSHLVQGPVLRPGGGPALLRQPPIP